MILTPMNTLSTNDENKNTPNNPETRVEVHYICSSTLASDTGKPKMYTAALNGNDKEKWIPAIKSEINNFIRQKVWTKFPCLELHGHIFLKSCWVFKKMKESVLLSCYKGYVVVKGNIQDKN